MGGAVVRLDRLGVDSHRQRRADESRGHRVGVAEHLDRAKAGNRHPQLPTEIQRHRRQGTQGLALLGPASLARQVTLADQVLEEVGVGGALGKVAAAADPQGLVAGQLEAVVSLLDVAVLVGLARIVGGRLQTVVSHQRLVASGRLDSPLGVKRPNGGAEVVGAVLTRHAAELPETALKSLGQGLEALGQTDLDRLDVRVGEHQVEDQVREGDPAESDPEIGHVGEVGLGDPARLVNLREEDLFVRAVLDPPDGDLALQSPQLACLVTPGMLLAEQPEQSGRLLCLSIEKLTTVLTE
jgi:hypothetical protein